jgi:hypothetical protein
MGYIVVLLVMRACEDVSCADASCVRGWVDRYARNDRIAVPMHIQLSVHWNYSEKSAAYQVSTQIGTLGLIWRAATRRRS